MSTEAHEWGRQFGALGHSVRLMAPKFVIPYRKSGKNDGNDAAAICEAVSRPSMRFIPVKTLEQQADGMRATTPRALSASGVTTSDVRCIALLDVADYAVFLCLAISSRTLGTSSVGIAMIVPEAFSDAASSSATASSSD